MNFRDLEQILYVAEERSISRASQKLYMSQPSISQTIKRVEQKMGYLLFERTPKGLVLTRKGEHFVAIAQQIIALKTDLSAKLKEVPNHHVGRMIIGLPTFFHSGILPEVIDKFCQVYPSVEIIIKETASTQMENMLLKGEVDVAIMLTNVCSEKIAHSVFLCEEMLIAMSPQNKIVSMGTPVKDTTSLSIAPEALKEQTFILSYTNQWMKQFADEFFSLSGFEPKGLIYVNSIETLKQLTYKDLGISFMPTSYVRYDLPDERLTYFSIYGHILPKWTLATAYLKTNDGNEMILAFVRLFSEYQHSVSAGGERQHSPHHINDIPPALTST